MTDADARPAALIARLRDMAKEPWKHDGSSWPDLMREAADALAVLAQERDHSHRQDVAESDDMLADLIEIGRLLGIPAKPYSGHEAVQRDYIPRMTNLIKQRDELLAALKGYRAVLAPWINPALVSFDEWETAVKRIDDAIAKAEGPG